MNVGFHSIAAQTRQERLPSDALLRGRGEENKDRVKGSNPVNGSAMYGGDLSGGAAGGASWKAPEDPTVVVGGGGKIEDVSTVAGFSQSSHWINLDTKAKNQSVNVKE